MSGTFSSGSPDRDQHIMEILREALLSPFEEASLFKETPALSAKQPPDSALVRIIHHPSVILILGHRGSGKSPLACRLQELLKDIALPYAVGLPANAARLLPTWYGLTRPQLRPIMDSARAAFAGVGVSRRKRLVCVFVSGESHEGRLMENMVPTFWSDRVSRVFSETVGEWGNRTAKAPLQGKGASGLSSVGPRRGDRTTIEQRRDKAKALKRQGYSYSEIGRVLGVGKSQAFRLVNGST